MTTDNEIRLKIAKLKGYRIWRVSSDTYYVLSHNYDGITDGEPVDSIPDGFTTIWRCEDWPRDMRMAWVLEESIPEDQRDHYVDKLIQVVLSESQDLIVRRDRSWDYIHATPRQRCLAWIAWKEAQP